MRLGWCGFNEIVGEISSGIPEAALFVSYFEVSYDNK
jgi:hypothetical protein